MAAQGGEGERSGRGDGKNPGSSVWISFASGAGGLNGEQGAVRSRWRHENKTSYQSIAGEVRRGILAVPPLSRLWEHSGMCILTEHHFLHASYIQTSPVTSSFSCQTANTSKRRRTALLVYMNS